MGHRRRRDGRDSDASATLWTKRVAWAVIIGCAAVLAYYLVRALWRLFGLILRTYSEAAMIWPLP